MSKTDSSWLAQLKDPPAAFRGAPFWAWNSKLDPAELVRQVGEFARAGLGGFFMHVRYGLETAYLSAEFLDCIKAVVAAAKKRGLEAWLYDEDRWPSGFAGGVVTADPKHRIKFLQLEKVPANEFTGPPVDAIRCFTAIIDGDRASEVRPWSADEARLPADNGPGNAARTVLVFRSGVSGDVGWFNNTGYLDTMSPAAVRAFLDATHEVYKKAVGQEFGRTIPGIFTDEPNFGHFRSWGKDTERTVAIPWTTALPGEFSRRFGYDLLDHLVELFYDVEVAQSSGQLPVVSDQKKGQSIPLTTDHWPLATALARHDFRRLTTELYTEAYSRQIGQWCAQNNLELTGHELSEESLPSQIDQVGACMPHYEHFQRPGIDLLMDREPEVLTAKQCVSVATQLGRPRVLSELYGCTGWDATFEMYKHIGDWHQVLGINHFCPHLSWYSMAGGAKRDYPAGIFYQSPWWADHKMLGDYFGRLSLAMSQGQAVREVAVIHPIESAWLVHKKQHPQASVALDQGLKHLCGLLLDNQYDFDFADESMLPRYAAVDAPSPTPGGTGGLSASGRKDTGGQAASGTHDCKPARLRIGQASYRAVVVPESLTLRQSTVELLEKFLDAGGRVVFVGRPPTLLDCQPSERLAALVARATRTLSTAAGLDLALGEACRPVRITPARWNDKDHPVAWVHLRNIPADSLGQPGQLLFVHHRDRQRESAATIRWAGVGRIQQIDPLSGKITDLPGVETKDGAQVFTTTLAPTGSLLFLRTNEPAGDAVAGEPTSAELGDGEPGRPRPRQTLPPVELRRIPLAPVWDYDLDEPNAINLDYCRVRVLNSAAGTGGQAASGDANWRPRKLIWQHEADIRREFGFRDNSRPAEQPYIWLKNLSPHVAQVEVEFEVPVEAAPTGPVSLVIEHPERFEISVNGKVVRPAGGKEPSLSKGKPGIDWFIDRSFRIVPLTGAKLVKGVNLVRLRTDYREHHWLEEVYLIGRFGVRTGRSTLTRPSPSKGEGKVTESPASGDQAIITALPKKLNVGDWVGQGLAMYSGAVTYRQTVRVPKLANGERVVLKMDRPKATVIRVAVNGRPVGTLGWQPWRIDITGAVKAGAVNQIEITLVSSRRNLLGPLHYVPANPLWTGPTEFRSESGEPNFTPNYNLVPYGLLGEAWLGVEK